MEHNQKNVFMSILTLSQALAITMVILVVVWTTKTLEGIAWDGSQKEFNLHPLCMICGFILLYGEAVLVFRVFRHHDKRMVKMIHGGFHLIAFATAIVGLVAVFDFHNNSNIANMYSLHSWCGLTTVILFTIQLTLGFLSFFVPGATQSLRTLYLPIHKYFGMAILFLAALTAVSGINEKLFFMYPNGTYSSQPHGAIIGNCLGLITVAFIIVVGFIAYNPDWKREQSEETEPLSVHFKQISSHVETDDE